MDEIEVLREETAPLSLYLDIEKGSRGDLEVVSRAAIAWAQTIREAAFAVDPFLEIRVEIVSGTEGSINLNSLIRAVRAAVADPKSSKRSRWALLPTSLAKRAVGSLAKDMTKSGPG